MMRIICPTIRNSDFFRDSLKVSELLITRRKLFFFASGNSFVVRFPYQFRTRFFFRWYSQFFRASRILFCAHIFSRFRVEIKSTVKKIFRSLKLWKKKNKIQVKKSRGEHRESSHRQRLKFESFDDGVMFENHDVEIDS